MKVFEILQPSIIPHHIWMMLTEDAKIDFIVNNMRNQLSAISHDHQARGKSPDDIVNNLTQADPTTRYTYLQFIVKMYTLGQFRLEDVNRLKETLVLYDRVKPRLPIEQRNILAIKSLSQLDDIVAPFEEVDIRSGKQVKQQDKTE
jgi:hypothetical protein